MISQLSEKTQSDSSGSYLLIKNEQLTSVVITSQVLAGSRILKSSYKHVVFSDCTFNASEFQDVIFDNCIFDNCSFEFSHLRNCQVINCNFGHCRWVASSFQDSLLSDCDLDHKLTELLRSGGNHICRSQRTHDHTTDIYIHSAVA